MENKSYNGNNTVPTIDKTYYSAHKEELKPYHIEAVYRQPTMKEAWVMFFKRYGDFNGRSRRAEFWKFELIRIIIAIIVISIILLGVLIDYGMTGEMLQSNEGFGVIFSILFGGGYALFSVICIVPYIALLVRRVHDLNTSGKWLLLLLVPVVGQVLGLLTLLIYCADGKPEPNQWGDSPKYVISYD